MKKYIKQILANISIDSYERLLAYSILKNKFSNLSLVKTFDDREALWEYSLHNFVDIKSPINYVEFGVHKGYSINYFAKNNAHKESNFIGLDSFEGLPEDWGSCKKGAFDTKGKVPVTKDVRISFIKGWFQDSWKILEKKLSTIPIENLVIHFDADLYSSTLFALSKVDQLKVPYIAIFDEFMGHETRALYDYCQAFNPKIEFLCKTLGKTHASIVGYPQQVVVRIIPNCC